MTLLASPFICTGLIWVSLHCTLLLLMLVLVSPFTLAYLLQFSCEVPPKHVIMRAKKARTKHKGYWEAEWERIL